MDGDRLFGRFLVGNYFDLFSFKIQLLLALGANTVVSLDYLCWRFKFKAVIKN